MCYSHPIQIYVAYFYAVDCRIIHTLLTCIFPIQNFTYCISMTVKWGGFDEFLNSNYYVFFLIGLCRNQTVYWIFNLFLHIFNFAVEIKQVSNQSSILGMGIAEFTVRQTIQKKMIFFAVQFL